MIGVLLINLGTPDRPTTPSVRKYLKQFLSDRRVIDINPVARWLFLNLLILPFRSPKSAAAYRQIWDDGSPLLKNSLALRDGVQKKLGANYAVELGMRYGNPSIESAIGKLTAKNVSEIKILPLYPQYASSSSGSSLEEAFRVLGSFWKVPPVTTLPAFYNDEGFVDSFAERGKPILEKIKPDHILFSFHGLPERHIQKGDPYREQSLQTASSIAARLNLSAGSWTSSFQSRLGRTPWIKPYTDLEIIRLVKEGKKRIVVFCPSFVADCLETLEEIGIRAKESALKQGAELLALVPSLNAEPRWVDAVSRMVS
jgi:ferrochelatase